MLKWIVRPYREILRPSYGKRPLASSVLRSYIRKRNHPSWTSYFIEYRQIQDDNFGQKHFNFDVDGHNYHILRVGCFPYIKYHCTKRPVQDLTAENDLYRLITVLNLAFYPLRDMVAPSCCLEYRPTLHFWFVVLCVIFPTIYLCGKIVGCFLTVLLRVLRGICRFLLWDEADYEEENRKLTEEKETEIRRIVEEREARREEARKRRREERQRLREETKQELKELLVAQAPKTNTNGALKTTVIHEEKLHRSDHSDSLISECEDENSQSTSGVLLSEPKVNGLRHRHTKI